MKTSQRLLLSLAVVGLCFTPAPRLHAQASGNGWSVAVLDEILASVPKGQPLARVGDMQIRVSNLRAWRHQMAGGPSPLSAFDGVVPIWPGGNVYYNFDGSVSAAKQKAFLDGAQEWAAFAGLHFIRRTSEANYITIQENPAMEGGSSAVGMVGGQQFLQLGPNSWNRGTICHELGHALGLVHEHQRSDRDGFVTVLTNNLLPGTEANFVKLGNSIQKGAYDFDSVMHYARNALSVNPATLDTLHPQPAYSHYIDLMGGDHDVVLSAADRAGMAAVYGAGPALTNRVTHNQDSGPGSLRMALYYAYDHPGTTVTFHLPPTAEAGFSNGVFNLQPTDQLPTLAHATTLDGTSQPTNANPSGPAIVLNGALASLPGVHAQGLRLRGTNCTVRGLIIHGFPAHGILITGSNAASNLVQGCYLGISASGASAVPNGLTPVAITDGAHDNTLGGTTAAARNVISGSASQGLVISGPGTGHNVVQGNYLGLNATGTAPLPNAWAGVAIYGGAQSNLIGGSSAGARNVISGNTQQGVTLSDPDTTGNVVEGNVIGLNPSGTMALANGWAGVDLFGGARSNRVGGTLAGSRNVISGNGAQGINLTGPGTSANRVQGNYLGLNAAGTAAISNAFAGIELSGGASANLIGGLTPGACNVISGNHAQGVALDGAGTAANTVQGNWIGTAPSGLTAIGNRFAGVEIFAGAAGNFIGGPDPAARNLISGNASQGVFLNGPGTDGNWIQGNYIGVDVTGAAALPNGFSGLELCCNARSNVLGGWSGAGNVISGNSNYGILLGGSGTDATIIQGNFIGLNAAGTAALGNAWSGVNLYSGTQATVIGGGAGARNVISGNGNHGVVLNGPGTTGNRVQGNTIGLNAAGSGAVPNTYSGIALWGGAQSNHIGGTAFATANLIAGNGSDGVQMFDATTLGNTVRGNAIAGNNGAGIGLYTGANRSAPAPTLTSAVVTTLTTLSGSLTDLPNTIYHLDFFCGTPGSFNPPARTWLGSADVMTGGGGTVVFSTNVNAAVPMGQGITATATDPAGNTSLLAATVLVTGTDSVGDGLPNAWRAARFGGNGTTTNNQSCAACDPDHDGLNNSQEFLAGTHPTNAASVLLAGSVLREGADVSVRFASVLGIPYRVERRETLTGNEWFILADQILGDGTLLPVTDLGAGLLPKRFYRVSALR